MAGRRPDPSRRRGRRLGVAAAALFALLALGVRAATASDAGTSQILIRNFRFEPTTLEIPVGASVTWLNQDEEIHTVSSTQGLFTSPGLDGDEHFSYRFEKPGTFEYHCALHPQMKGTIVVR